MVTEVPLKKGRAAKLQAARLQGGGSIGEQDGGGGQATGTKNKQQISAPSKEGYKPAPLDKNHSNHKATLHFLVATLLKRKEKALEMKMHNIFYLTRYMQNITIATCGTSQVSSAQ